MPAADDDDVYRVAFYRWFPHDGATFAVHPWFHERKNYEHLTTALADVTKNAAASGPFLVESAGGGWYVGERFPDPDPIDPEAKSRGGAFVVVAAYIPGRESPDRAALRRILDHLKRRPLPTRTSADEGLQVRVPRPVVPPPPPPPPPPDGLARPPAAPSRPYVAVSALAVGVALVFLADPISHAGGAGGSPGLVAALLGAVGGIALATAAFGLFRHFAGGAHAARDLAHRIEEEWRLYQNRRGVKLDPRWVGVTARGEMLSGPTKPEVLAAEFPDLLAPDFAPLVRFNGTKLEVVGRDARGREWYHVFEIASERDVRMLFAGTVPTAAPAAPTVRPPAAEPPVMLTDPSRGRSGYGGPRYDSEDRR